MLSDAKIRSLKPTPKPYRLADRDGLCLEVATSGSKLWRWRYRLGGKASMLSLGQWPDVSLIEAREAVAAARKLVAQGINPAIKRKADTIANAEAAQQTFKATALRYVAERLASRTPGYRADVLAAFESDVFRKIGGLPLAEVKASHVRAVLNTVFARAPTKAKALRSWIGAVFRWVDADHDPTAALRNAFDFPAVQHHPPLPAELWGQHLRGIDATSADWLTRCAARLAWLTVLRINEACGARWAEIDLANALWVLPSERMKMGKPHAVPLSRQAVALLIELREITGNREHVFPGRNNPRGPISAKAVSALFASVRTACGYEVKFTPHGVRGTFSTYWHDAGTDSRLVELCLAHCDKDKVRAAYNHAERIADRREMFQRWADLLEAAEVGATVLKLRA
jgi:integrase